MVLDSLQCDDGGSSSPRSSVDLPVDSWRKVASYLADDAASVARAACVCRTAREAAASDETLWRQLLEKDYRPTKTRDFPKNCARCGNQDHDETADADGPPRSRSRSGSGSPPQKKGSAGSRSPPSGRSSPQSAEADARAAPSARECYQSWASCRPGRESVFRNVHCLRNNENAVLYGSRVNALVLDPPGAAAGGRVRHCWSCGGDGVVQKWDMEREETVLSIRGVHQINQSESNFKQVNNMGVECADACGPSCLVTGGCDKGISMWDSRASDRRANGPHMEVWHRSAAHYDEVLSVACSKTLPLVVSGGADDCVRVWDTRWMDQPLLELDTLHGGSVFAIAIDDAAKRCYTGSSDKTLSLWDLESGHWLSQAHGHAGDIYDIVLGTERILTASDDGTVREWALDGNREWFQELVCSQVLGADAQMDSMSEDSCKLDFKRVPTDVAGFRGVTPLSCLSLLGAEEKHFLAGTWSGDVVMGHLDPDGRDTQTFSKAIMKNVDLEEKDDGYYRSHSPVTAIAATTECVITGFNYGAVRFSRMMKAESEMD
mmetsp:Transcript_31330/g.67542  ORF Transcript_31330/g.67542 Transcript_31330/m.67542 type:complete len:547 (+) Transcript_31330:179-1819(+)